MIEYKSIVIYNDIIRFLQISSPQPLNQTQIQRCLCGPQVIFVPGDWWHGVLNLEVTKGDIRSYPLVHVYLVGGLEHVFFPIYWE